MKTGVLLLGLVLQSSMVWADDAAILRCRALAEAGPRLACYDALANGIVPAAKGATVAAPVPAVAGVAPSANIPTPTPPQQAASQFGLERQAQAQVESIQSRIDGKFEGWTANALLTLANGQVWQISDGSRAYVELVNPKVSVRRGFMGAYYLDIDGSNLTPRVRRVK
jgi:hypothetical protein